MFTANADGEYVDYMPDQVMRQLGIYLRDLVKLHGADLKVVANKIEANKLEMPWGSTIDSESEFDVEALTKMRFSTHKSFMPFPAYNFSLEEYIQRAAVFPSARDRYDFAPVPTLEVGDVKTLPVGAFTRDLNRPKNVVSKPLITDGSTPSSMPTRNFKRKTTFSRYSSHVEFAMNWIRDALDSHH